MFSDAGVDMRPGPRRRGPGPMRGGPMRGGPMSHEAGVQPMQPSSRPMRPPMRPTGPLPGYNMDTRLPAPGSGEQMEERPPMPNVFQSRPEPGSLNMPNRIPPSDNPYVHNFVPGAGAPPPMDLHDTETNMQGMGILPMPAQVREVAYHSLRPLVPGIPIAPGIRIPVPRRVDAVNEAAHLEAQHKQAVEMLLRIQEKVGAGHKPTPQEAHFVQVMARPLLALR
jgi:hypothetical protein